MHLSNLFENDSTDWQSRIGQKPTPEDLAKGREIILQTLKSNLDNKSNGIFYMLHEFERFGLKLKDWPEVKSWIEDYKRFLLNSLMKSETDAAKFFLDRMINIGVDWPELAIINKNLEKKFGKLDESNSLVTKKIQKILDKYKIQPKDRKFFVQTLITELKATGIPDSDFKLILRQELPWILHELSDFRDERYLRTWVPAFLSLTALRDELGNVPAINELLQDLQEYVMSEIKYCLENISYHDEIKKIINTFDSPQDAEFKKKLKNMVRDFAVDQLKKTTLTSEFNSYDFTLLLKLLQTVNVRIKAGRVLDNILKNFINSITTEKKYIGKGVDTHVFLSLLLSLADEGLPERLIEILNKHKTFILKEILGIVKVHKFKAGIFVDKLDHLGIDWPELKTIRREIMKAIQR